MINLDTIDATVSRGPYSDNWESLSNAQTPDWFPKAKFGIFTHWGLYSIPAYRNEWYPRNMYIKDHPEFRYHQKTFGKQYNFGYKDFIPLFTAEKFDPDQWLDIFHDCGARYYFPVSEHHDGFQMYKSDLSVWNAYHMGPHRDLLGELRKSTLTHGLHFATSNHRAEHWWFMGNGRNIHSDIGPGQKRGDFYWPAQPEPEDQFDWWSRPYPSEEFLNDWLLRVCEIIDNYHPELLYFDWWIQHEAFKPYIKKLAAFYYNRSVEWGHPVSICYKDDSMAWGSGIVDVERGGMNISQPFVWQTDTSVARNSWSYTNNLDYKSLSELLSILIDTVSKNGNMLLNVGPKADGTIAEQDQDLLAGIGAWLRINGEGIYNTKTWKIAQEGPTVPMSGAFSDQSRQEWSSQDFRFTARDGAVYAFCLNPQGKEFLTVTAFSRHRDSHRSVFHGIVKKVEQLGFGSVAYDRRDEGMIIKPHYSVSTGALNRLGSDIPLGFKITLE